MTPLPLYKGLNKKEGFGPADDRPPEIWFSPMDGLDGQPLVLRDYFGKTELTREDIAGLLKDYYDERGWKGAASKPKESAK